MLHTKCKSAFKRFLPTFLFLLFAATVFWCEGFCAENGRKAIAVVVHEGAAEKIERNEILAVFLGGKTVWSANGAQIRVVLQPKTAGASKLFNEIVFGDGGRKVARQWIKNIMTGGAPAPILQKSDFEVLRKVSELEGAVGYVMYGAAEKIILPEGVKIAAIIDSDIQR